MGDNAGGGGHGMARLSLAFPSHTSAVAPDRLYVRMTRGGAILPERLMKERRTRGAPP